MSRQVQPTLGLQDACFTDRKAASIACLVLILVLMSFSLMTWTLGGFHELQVNQKYTYEWVHFVFYRHNIVIQFQSLDAQEASAVIDG